MVEQLVLTGCGSGSRRCHSPSRAGTAIPGVGRSMTAPRWPALRALLLAQLRSLGELELDRCVGDGSHMRALEGGSRRRAPGRPRPAGSKHRLICDAGGIPPAVRVTGGNRHDVTHLIPLIEAIPPIRGTVGKPRRRPR